MATKWTIVGIVFGLVFFAGTLALGLAWYWAVLIGFAAFGGSRDIGRALLIRRR